MTGQPGPKLDASPTVVGGRVYIGAKTGVFYALDASTGAVVWKRQLDYGSNTYCAAKGIVGTATVQPDPVDGALTVYAAGAHYLYALNAATGAIRWKTAIGPATSAGEALYFNWSSPTVASGRIFMGLAANCESRLIRGGVVSLDQHTGAVLHTYHALPAGKVGASVWSSEAANGTTAWATTGNPDPNGTTVDDAYSIVELTASTLAKQDKWTVPAGQSADLDFGSSPTLFSATLGGVNTKLVAACNKNGILYTWRQGNVAGGPVWKRRVGATAGAGESMCITSPAWDFQAQRLFVAANTTTISGQPAAGSIRALAPASGAVIWEKSLPCSPVGSPTLNATTHLVAVPLYNCPTGTNPGVALFNETDGSPLTTLQSTSRIFAQPVFAEGKLFVATETGGLTAYAP